MNGKIDGDGKLNIERGGKMFKQLCPFAADMCSCGDWCPLFGEPEEAHSLGEVDGRRVEEVLVSLCHGQLILSTFTDERKADK